MQNTFLCGRSIKVRQAKFRTESQMKNSQQLGITLPELQKYQRCLQNDTDLFEESHTTSIQKRQNMKVQLNRIARSKLDNENSFSQNYSVDDQLKYKKKAPLAAYVYSGYQIVDYNDKVNRLHRQLLKKVLLNK